MEDVILRAQMRLKNALTAESIVGRSFAIAAEIRSSSEVMRMVGSSCCVGGCPAAVGIVALMMKEGCIKQQGFGTINE